MGTLSQKSVVLDGSNEYIVVGNVAALQFERTNAFSLSAWVQLTSTGTRMVCAKGSGSSGYSLYVTNGQVFFDLVNAFPANTIEVRTGNVLLPTGAWTHLVATYDGSSTAAGVAIYFNGTSIPLTTNYDTLSASILNANAFDIGRRSDGYYWGGGIDAVAVYNKQLSGAEVTAIHNGYDPPDLTVTGPTANLVGYWKIGDGDTYPTATDSSASGNNGTYTNTESTDIVNYGAGVQTIDDPNLPYNFDSLGLAGNSYDIIPTGLDSGGGAAPTYYKMRALADPGPGYVTWVVANTPDFAGTYAPSAIQAGTVIVGASWVG